MNYSEPHESYQQETQNEPRQDGMSSAEEHRAGEHSGGMPGAEELNVDAHNYEQHNYEVNVQEYEPSYFNEANEYNDHYGVDDFNYDNVYGSANGDY